MKGLFAPEFLQWRKTATAALDMEVEPTEGKSRIEPFGAEPVTQGPTMALRPGLSSSGVRAGTDVPAERTQSRASRSHGSRSQLSRSQTAPSAASAPTSPTSASVASSPSATSQVEPPSKRDRVWVYGGLAILGAITAAVAWMLARPPGPAAGESVRPPALAMPAISPVPAAAPDQPPKPEAPKPEAVKPAAPAGTASGPTAAPAGPPAPTPAPATTAVPALAPPVAQSPETPPAAAQPAKAASHPRPRRRIHPRHDEASAAAPASGGTTSDGKADPFE
jgi:ribonuclease E